MQYAAAVGTAPGVRVALIELALQLKLAPLRVSSEARINWHSRRMAKR